MALAANWLAHNRLVRWLGDRMLGIDRRRVVPGFARQPFHNRSHESRGHNDSSNSRSVLLFCDTFTDLFEPELGIAAHRLLAGAGCRVEFGLRGSRGAVNIMCCGRPLISNGLLAQAVRHAQHNVEALHRWAVTGRPVIACEPSCLLTIKDDYPALLRGEQRRKAETVAAACLTFEQFLESLLAEPKAGLGFRVGHKRILVQGHCHQRSLTGLESTLRLLRRIPGAEVIDLDAGCCGMAGSFGYEKEHYEISRAVGEQRLFPALRQSRKDTVIVAPGFSCRRQIEHFTGLKALHPAELLWSLIGEPH